jgi:Protein of unknown function (DUF3137)
MEGIKNFETFYTLKVAPLLEKLNAEQKEGNAATIRVVIFGILTVAAFIISSKGLLAPAGTIISTLLLLVTVYNIYNAIRSGDKYIADFKESVIGEIIKYLNPNLVYRPDQMVPSKYYRQSGLFRKRYDDYAGDDYIGGIYKGVEFFCSEINTTTRDNNGGRSFNTIFKGLFFTATINKNYTGGTYVWIKDEEQFGASISEERYRLLPFPEVYDMKMGDKTFDTYFSVCSTNPAEARTILDSYMMQRLLEFRRQIKRKVVFSVVLGRCYVAIPISENLLEPTEPLGDKEAVKKYFFTILLILSIVNQLELNKLT